MKVYIGFTVFFAVLAVVADIHNLGRGGDRVDSALRGLFIAIETVFAVWGAVLFRSL